MKLAYKNDWMWAFPETCLFNINQITDQSSYLRNLCFTVYEVVQVIKLLKYMNYYYLYV